MKADMWENFGRPPIRQAVAWSIDWIHYSVFLSRHKRNKSTIPYWTGENFLSLQIKYKKRSKTTKSKYFNKSTNNNVSKYDRRKLMQIK